jgi:hypothetical protein
MVAAQRVNIADEYSYKDVASNQGGEKSKEDEAFATETVLQLLKVAHEGITEVFVWGDDAIGPEQKKYEQHVAREAVEGVQTHNEAATWKRVNIQLLHVLLQEQLVLL